MSYHQQSVQALYLRYKHRLVLFAGSFISCSETAQDIVTDVFNQLLRDPKVFNDQQHEQNSLYLRVRNRCLDHLRYKPATGSILPFDENEPVDIYEMNEREEFEKEYTELIRLIYVALDTLPKRTRDAFIACKLEGRSIREVSDSMGISVSRVKNYVNEAKQLLRLEILQPKKDFSWLKLWLLSLPYLLQLMEKIWCSLQPTVH